MRRRRALIAATALLAGARLPDARSEEPAWRVLAGGGWALLLRHAQTEPGIGDPPGFRLDDCSTQRNLSDAGRAQARRLGEELARRGIRVDEVLSSRWCRCIDTAALAFPQLPVRVFAPLNSFFEDGSRREAQTRELRDFLARQASGRRLALVTHQVNISALTGEFAQAGEAVVVGLGPGASGASLARLRLD